MAAPKVNYGEITMMVQEGDKNAHKIYCPFNNCSSLIMLPGVGVLSRRGKIPKEAFDSDRAEKIVDDEAKPEGATDDDGELFWVVADPFHFENLGFSKSSSSGIKYLACADCDRGPLGYHDPQRPEYLLSAKSVLYMAPPS
ncbi:Mss4-like protein [Limtongia smithiae]|uniref:Mss4-like protein n=1 Tax=Limtongia smithiae TaxID=1125753 RepID=UPI0034CD2F8B